MSLHSLNRKLHMSSYSYIVAVFIKTEALSKLAVSAPTQLFT